MQSKELGIVFISHKINPLKFCFFKIILLIVFFGKLWRCLNLKESWLSFIVHVHMYMSALN